MKAISGSRLLNRYHQPFLVATRRFLQRTRVSFIRCQISWRSWSMSSLSLFIGLLYRLELLDLSNSADI